MAQRMMVETKASTAGRNAEYNRKQAMQVWEAVHPTMNRTPVHPMYMARRRQNGRSLAHHALGTLLVLGALMLMANV